MKLTCEFPGVEMKTLPVNGWQGEKFSGHFTDHLATGRRRPMLT